jgi:hypothetical protein
MTGQASRFIRRVAREGWVLAAVLLRGTDLFIK